MNISASTKASESKPVTLFGFEIFGNSAWAALIPSCPSTITPLRSHQITFLAPKSSKYLPIEIPAAPAPLITILTS